jgi:hypothetical protein
VVLRAVAVYTAQTGHESGSVRVGIAFIGECLRPFQDGCRLYFPELLFFKLGADAVFYLVFNIVVRRFLSICFTIIAILRT